MTYYIPTAHGGVRSLRKASTESKQDNEVAEELGPFGSTEALDVLNKAAELVYCCHDN